jgi:hypothetical protein
MFDVGMAGKKKKNPSAMTLGRLGGRARATALSEKSRKEIASGAGKSAWQSLTPEERSTEMKRRAVVRAENAKKKVRAGARAKKKKNPPLKSK